MNYKSFNEGLKSVHGNVDWKVGEWVRVDEPEKVRACSYGFHSSKRTIDAMSYVSCSILAEVEVRGNSDLSEFDKECWSEMRIINAYNWTKKDSVALSIFAAELCIAEFEKFDSTDNRPRQAIEAAKSWLENPSPETESAAWSAAWSAAESAGSAACSAGPAAWSAAESARSAACSAARSARSAAWSAARSAAESARSAAKEAILDRIDEWIKKRIETLEPYVG